jgi:alkanesulfonate monooxygenase SsuD/methylene tetrahydromethanopterin reductase-like flavin-dependent oxidoreductase (luciferase family)
MTGPRLGVLLPTRERAIAGSWDTAPLLEFARDAEAAGFDSLWVGDSLLARPRLDALLALAMVAPVTHRIALGTACLVPALRHPVIGASLVASLHHLIGGRLELAVGSGFPIPAVQAEFAAAEVPFETRFGRCDDTVRLWRQAWRSRQPARAARAAADSAGEASWPRRYWPVTGLDRLLPAASTAGPRIWYAGGDTPRVVGQVAALYDGWLPFLPSAADYAVGWRRIQERSRANGRPADAVYPGMYATIAVNEDPAEARAELEEYVQAYYGYPLELCQTVQAFRPGSMEECAEFLGQYVRAGARHLVIRIGSLRPSGSLKELHDALRTLLPDCVD